MKEQEPRLKKHPFRRGVAAAAFTVGSSLGLTPVVESLSPAAASELPQSVLTKKDPGEKPQHLKPEKKKEKKKERKLSKEEKQILKVAASIKATNALSMDQLNAWVQQGNQIATGRGGDFDVFDFPILSINDQDVGDYLEDKGITTITYPSGFEYKPTPHLSLVRYSPTLNSVDTLLLLNGVVGKKTENGKVSIAFGTQIYPDGTKLTLAWIAAIDDSENSLTAYPQSDFLRDKPVIGTIEGITSAAKSSFDIRLVGRDEYLKSFRDNVSKVARLQLNDNTAYDNIQRTDVTTHTSLVIPGVNYFPENSLNAYKNLYDAWFNGDTVQFNNFIVKGEEDGVLFRTSPEAGTQIEVLLDKITSVEAAFAQLPVGATIFIDASSSPLDT